MTPLDGARARLHTLRGLTSAAMHRMADGEVARALRLASAALERAQEIKVAYGVDELALDSLVSAMAVCSVISRQPMHEAHRDRVRVLYERAVAIRLLALTGEAEESAA